MKKIVCSLMLPILLLLTGFSVQAASSNFTSFPRHLAKADIDFDTATLKVMLVSTAPTEANLDDWTVRADVTTEVVGMGYTSGGINQSYTLSALDKLHNRQAIVLKPIDEGWRQASFTVAGAIIYTNTGASSTDKLITYLDFGSQRIINNGVLSLRYNTPIYLNR